MFVTGAVITEGRMLRSFTYVRHRNCRSARIAGQLGRNFERAQSAAGVAARKAHQLREGIAVERQPPGAKPALTVHQSPVDEGGKVTVSEGFEHEHTSTREQ